MTVGTIVMFDACRVYASEFLTFAVEVRESSSQSELEVERVDLHAGLDRVLTQRRAHTFKDTHILRTQDDCDRETQICMYLYTHGCMHTLTYVRIYRKYACIGVCVYVR